MSYWTKEKLDRLEAQVDDFKRIALDDSISDTEKKRLLQPILFQMEDCNAKSILNRNMGALQHMASAVSNARGDIQMLRELHLPK